MSTPEELPPLPAPVASCIHSDKHNFDVYTADQMRAYAIAARCQTSLKLAPVGCGDGNTYVLSEAEHAVFMAAQKRSLKIVAPIHGGVRLVPAEDARAPNKLHEAESLTRPLSDVANAAREATK